MTVEFVDYGNTDTLPPASLKVLPAEFSTLPVCCIDVALHDVDPKEISAEDLKEYMEKNHVEKTLTLQIIKIQHPRRVEAYVFGENESGHINDLAYEIFLKPEDSSSSLNVSAVAADTSLISAPSVQSTENMSYILVHHPYIFPELEKNSTIEVLCTFIESVQDFKCQLLSHQSDLEKVQELLAEHADSSSVLESREPGAACIALYSEDGAWYRGRIMSLTEDAAVVEFVDFGNSDKVPFSNIRVINQDLLEIPLVCVRCRLAVVDVSCEQEDLAIKYLSDKLLDTTFLVTVESVEEDKETFIGNVSPTDNNISDVFTRLSNLKRQCRGCS